MGPTTNLVNSSFTKVQVQRDGVVVISDKQLAEVVLSPSVKTIRIDAGVTIINANNTVTVTGEGTIDKFVITNINAIIQLGPKVKVNKLVLPKDVQPESVITNYNQVKNNIPQIQDTDGKTIINGSSGGGGGGGSIDRPVPVPMIAAIEPVRFTIEQNTVFKLPQTVVAQYSDGTARNAAVLWDLKTVNSTVTGT